MATHAEIAAAAARVAECDTAISAILQGAQSYTIAGRSLTRADLATIYQMRRDFDRAYQALLVGGSRGARLLQIVPRDT